MIKNQEKEPNPPQRKKYVEVQNFFFDQEKCKGVELPSIWIDSNDIETIKQFARFWMLHPYKLLEILYKLNCDKRDEFFEQLKRCAKTLSSQSQKKNIHNAYINYILELSVAFFIHMEMEGESNLWKGWYSYWKKGRKNLPKELLIETSKYDGPQLQEPSGSYIYDKSKALVKYVSKSLSNFFSLNKNGKELCSKQFEGLIGEGQSIQKWE